MQRAEKMHKREEIMNRVWGEDSLGDDNLLDVYIRYLRQKVEEEEQPTLIHTIRGGRLHSSR